MLVGGMAKLSHQPEAKYINIILRMSNFGMIFKTTRTWADINNL